MNPFDETILDETRRQFFGRTSRGIGLAALATILGSELKGADKVGIPGLPGLPHFPPKAKRAVFMHMLGGPPQLDLFDYKPNLKDWYNKDLPESIRGNQRLTSMTANLSRYPVAPSRFKFTQQGKSETWISEALPYTARMTEDITVLKSVYQEAINHEPATTYMQTGFMVAGKPCLGAWLSYGLGSMNRDLPTFAVINATHTDQRANVQAISARMWSAGFPSAQYAGVALRGGVDPVLYIQNPDGVPASVRREMLNAVDSLNEIQHNQIADPQTMARIAQYEMAFRMQTSVPELADTSKEPASIWAMYGDDARKPGTFANSCLMARRLLERDVRFVQIYHRGWDLHGNIPSIMPNQCKDVDQGGWALVQDLKQRGLLEDTLVVWTGEFGRTVFSQGNLESYGRDHHAKVFSLWMAGGGIKPGITYGESDDFSFNVAKDPVHVRDLQATILHQFGIDHERFVYKYLGLEQKLTGVDKAYVVKDILV
jgi:uncharacterized protein (DUF1501 family)